MINKIYGQKSTDDNQQAIQALPVENQLQEPLESSVQSYDYAETITEEEPLSLLQKRNRNDQKSIRKK